jgi:hypothetical protein
MKRPTFFISSTIYDFRDVRSALKFFLEEQGCKVLASEFNDFEKDLDLHSYEACLQTIHSADYFVLLIGGRVGGWYDKSRKISITQREYREAYKLQTAGKIKLLNLVRADVWQARDDRQQLAKFLETTSLDPATKNAISNHSTKLLSDADFIIRFIEEVAKNEETKLAISGAGKAPTGNWIHTFATFRDVADVLHGQVFSSTPVEDMTTKRLLRRELRDIVGQCLFKYDKKIYSPRWAIEAFHEKHPLTLGNKGKEDTTISTKRWDAISMFAVHLLARHLHPVVLPQVLSSPTFLQFDLHTNSYVETEVYGALVRLREEIRKFNHANTSENLSIIFKHTPRTRLPRSEWIEVNTIELAGLLHLLDRWSNVLDLSAAITQHLDGKPFSFPVLRPDTPVQGMQEMLDDERASEDDISSFIANPQQ